MKEDLALFEGHEIRRVYDEKTETWLFSVIDIVRVLAQHSSYQAARKYWKVLKGRLAKEGSQLVTNCYQLKMAAEDGRQRLTDVADAETLLRLVQSVPSPKAEPIKLWLARTGYQRMQKMSDPARAVDRARDTWQRHGRSEKWIQQRMTGQETRNKLTDYWATREIKKGDEFATLTNLIHQEWSGVSVKTHKSLKGLKTQPSRPHERGGTDLHRPRRAFDPSDCRNRDCNGNAGEREGGEAWREDRPARPAGARVQDRSAGRDERELPSPEPGQGNS